MTHACFSDSLYAMRSRMRILPAGLLTMALLSSLVWAVPDDIEGSHDYPGFPRPPGFFITDYNEDSPATFDFPIARSLPIDADHMETVHVKGHRYVIRYGLGSASQALSVFQTQQYYEKLAADAGFTAEKTGAVGDVTETFHKAKAGHDIWVYLEPAGTIDVLTVVESSGAAPPPRKLSASTATPTPSYADTEEDALYATLRQKGHVALPLTFLPGKPDLDADSQPVIDQVVKMMQNHPDLLLQIDGYTDDSGDARDNLRLSTQRANAVRALIIAAHVDKNRLEAVGRGGVQPVADNNTAEGREKNRRIELVMPGAASALFHASAPNGTDYYPSSRSSPEQY